MIDPNIVCALERMTDEECKQMFRFTLPEIQRICNALGLDRHLKYPSLTVESQFAMAMLLYLYAFPRRRIDISKFFGMSVENVSKVTNVTTKPRRT